MSMSCTAWETTRAFKSCRKPVEVGKCLRCITVVVLVFNKDATIILSAVGNVQVCNDSESISIA